VDVRTDLPEGAREAAEEVRRHLVSLRGRGLFLSSADALLLVSWLDAGVDVPRIVLALERAAAARQQRPSRTPLQLSHAKRHLGKPTRGTPWRAAPVSAGRWGPALHGLSGSPAHEALVAALSTDLGAHPERRFRAASTAVRDFFDARWDEAGDAARAAWEASALADLGDLADAVDEATLQELVDEGARARLRAGYPALSAASLWELAESGAVDGGQGA